MTENSPRVASTQRMKLVSGVCALLAIGLAANFVRILVTTTIWQNNPIMMVAELFFVALFVVWTFLFYPRGEENGA